MANSPKITEVILVTGMSGAGKSTILNVLEDRGYESIDNMPLKLLSNLLELKDDNKKRKSKIRIALGVDLRTRAFRRRRIEKQIDALKASGKLNIKTIFVDCDDETLVKRFSENRRRHPLAEDRPVEDGIKEERDFMARVKQRSDFIIDTTGLTIHDTKRRLDDLLEPHHSQHLTVTCMSFGFSRGIPRNADLIFDMRFLKNPHYEPQLRRLTGLDGAVADYIQSDPNLAIIQTKLEDLIKTLLPLYDKEGKAYVLIAFGCTGGQHRSVFVTDNFGKLLENNGYEVNIIHRDLDDHD